MNAKTFIILAGFLIAECATAQNHEAADSLTRELQEVVVAAQQPATRLVGSTLISTISGSNLADLGCALDVLAQLPMIQVQDNAVSVIGKSDVEIYIDGRPMRDSEELQQLLSSNMKTVELLMAPGAAYDSSTGAVLRITTRRRFMPGLSLTDILDVKRRRKWSAVESLNLSYCNRKFEFFLNGIINRDNSLINGTTTNKLVYDGKGTSVGSTQRSAYPTLTGAVKAGFNYDADTWSLGAYYRFNPERGSFTNSGSEWLNGAPAIDRNISKQINARSHMVSVYYEQTFANNRRLHFDGDFRQSNARNGVLTAYTASPDRNVNSKERRTSTLFAGKLYTNLPLLNGELTCGTQAGHTRTSLDYHMLNPQIEEYIPSSLTDAKQTAAALFASWARTFGRLSLSVGARYEYVDYDFIVNGKRDNNISRRYHLLTPDLSLGYSFNDHTQLNLSYKTATVKPPYAQLTGSLSYVGLHEIEGGNAALRDERMHNVQLFGMWHDFMVQTDFIRSIDTYAYVKQLYPANNLQLLMRPVNINVSAVSCYLIWSKPIRRWIPNVTLGIYRQWLTLDNARHNKPIFSYYFDNTFALPRGWQITANICGQTCGDMHTNRFGTTLFTVDASIGKTFLNKALTMKLSATDIFNTANNDWTMNTCGILVDKRQNYDRRGLTLNIIYRFRPTRSRYKGSSAAEAEIRRL